MSKVYFTSDWHFGHKAILKYRPQFSSLEAHDDCFIQMFNRIVKKRDIVFFLGDIAFTQEGLNKLKVLRFCKKVLYLGNHDTLPIKQYLEVFDEIHSLRSYKGYWVTHCPIHPQEIRNRKGCIHGHLHNKILDDRRYFDVCPEKNNYQLVDFEKIKSVLAEQRIGE